MIDAIVKLINEVEKRTTARQQCLRTAFTILDVRQQNWIDGATLTALLHAMSSYRFVSNDLLTHFLWNHNFYYDYRFCVRRNEMSCVALDQRNIWKFFLTDNKEDSLLKTPTFCFLCVLIYVCQKSSFNTA